jgi:hypothetical protein
MGRDEGELRMALNSLEKAVGALSREMDVRKAELDAARKELASLKSKPREFTRDDLIAEIKKMGGCFDARSAVAWVELHPSKTPQELWDICTNHGWMEAWINHVNGGMNTYNHLYYSPVRIYRVFNYWLPGATGVPAPKITPDWIRFVYPVFHYPGSDSKFRE